LLNDAEIELAGIRVEPARKHGVYRIIELVGSVAYDPELVIAQEEYLTARSMISALDGADEVTLGRAQQVIDKARYKLRLLGMDDTEILHLARTGRVTSSLVMPDGEAWVYADAYETDIPWIRTKQQVRVTVQAYPGEEFGGVIASVNPTLNTMTRAVRIRIRLNHGSGKLKPGMYVSVMIQASYTSGHAKNDVIVVPRSAVINTGNRTVVWVYKGKGSFEPRLVKLGPAGSVEISGQETRVYPILAGLDDNELIVVNGNFLIDSESQITGIVAIGYGGALEVNEQ
jgi:Cu(I)/Ag(I) efflux system membrane fusion protein